MKLEVVTMANIRRIKPQFLVMGVIANNVQYGWLMVVMLKLKMLPPNYDLDNSL